MFSKYLSIFMLFVLTTFSFTLASAKPVTVGVTQSGPASFYGKQHHNRKTASGERFNMYGLTAAHRSLPLGCKIKVTNQDNGKSVILKVNDRGPFHGNRILDVSQGAAKQLGFIKQGLAKIDIEVLSLPEKKQKVSNGKHTKLNERSDRTASGGTSATTPAIDERSSTTVAKSSQRINSANGPSSGSNTGSTISSANGIGYTFNDYEESDDSITRLIASGYVPPVDGKSTSLLR